MTVAEQPPTVESLLAANAALKAELAAVNQELETFAYSVSHDLRAPLRSIDGFSLILQEDYAAQLGPDGQKYLDRVRAAAQRMASQFDALLVLSRIGRAELRRTSVDLTALADTVAAKLAGEHNGRQVTFVRPEGLTANGDQRLLLVVLENLLGNAWKFTSRQAAVQVELGQTQVGDEQAYFVRDNGVGFDLAYSQRLFGAFQRLHDPAEFPGTGIGLATVQRIVSRHGGHAWAEAQVDAGATFYFTLGH